MDIKFDGVFTSELGIKSGVYKIVFDNGMFYIGSAKDIKHRFSFWKRFFSLESYRDMKKMRERVKGCYSAEFLVVEFIGDGWRDVEYRYIKENFHNPLLLNTFSVEKKPIIEYDSDGNKIRDWGSAAEAARVKGIKYSRVRDVLVGYIKSHKGVVYKYKNKEDLCFCGRRKYKKRPKRWNIEVYKCDGSFVGVFESARKVEEEIKVPVKLIYSVFTGKQKTSNGYTFKKIYKN